MSRIPGKGRRFISTAHDKKRRKSCVILILSLVVALGWLLRYGSSSTQSHAYDSHKYETILKKQNDSSTDKSRSSSPTSGAIVFLAPQRNQGSLWATNRFCLLLRAIRSVDQHLNAQFGPYPIFLLVARDHELDPLGKDAAYTPEDRALLRKWAPQSELFFVEIDMYSRDALEPNTSVDQITNWRAGVDGGVKGRDLGYQSMCRLWSGRLQHMSFLDGFDYYLRMDDDSLFLSAFQWDPFVRMEAEGLTYAYRRTAYDSWGIDELWSVSRSHLDLERDSIPFALRDGADRSYSYFGEQPYNNFHISDLKFWRSPQWTGMMRDMDDHHLFFKYRVGDANVHAISIMMMEESSVAMWPETPYAHNSNDYHNDWGQQSWQDECDAAIRENKKHV